MSDPVTLFPNLLPAARTYGPVGVKFWEGEEAILAGMKEFADGWFERRRIGTHAALETARRMSEAATPLDAVREYQDWLSGAAARVLEDGIACQQQFLKANARLAPHLPHTSKAEAPPPEADDRLSA
ncbi:conserved hypothetical protein [Rhodopseudomonas palustris HaA2]|uniref:Phasin domain-containing protein n=1 Tax=Rhodopseudomonas palustris (strain HaA2) TaxID=316058 RepID=Q2IZF6_RHOP2|nr:hypothetical protein [Rhodopseudomonas palustris]ABD06404.1 conserved hypothetical protein [Rhodopseudomonas palustris HaA2]